VVAVPKIKSCQKCSRYATYENFLILDPLMDLTMYWTVVGPDIRIAIEQPKIGVCGATCNDGSSGWIYVGLSNNGQHHQRSDGKLPADAWAIHASKVASHPCNPFCIMDLNVPSDPLTQKDTTDDLTNKAVSTVGGYLTGEFTRKLDTGDASDIKIDITLAGQTILWGTRDDDGRAIWGVGPGKTLFPHHGRRGDRVVTWDRTRLPRPSVGTAPVPALANSRVLSNGLTEGYEATFYWQVNTAAQSVDFALVANVPNGTIMFGFNQFADHAMRCPAPGVPLNCALQFGSPSADAYTIDAYAGSVSSDPTDPICYPNGCVVDLYMQQDDRQPLTDPVSNVRNVVVTRTAGHLMLQLNRLLNTGDSKDTVLAPANPLTVIWGVNPFTRVEGGNTSTASYFTAVPPRHYIPWHTHRDDFVIKLSDPLFGAPITTAPVDCATHKSKLSGTYPNCVLLDSLNTEHFWLYWRFEGTGTSATLRLGLVAEGVSGGWMGLGLSSDRLHTRRTSSVVDGWIATMAGTVPHLLDASFPDELDMVIDATNNLLNATVSASGSFLIAEFGRLLDTGDAVGDRVLDVCGPFTTFIWATRSHPQYTNFIGGWPVVFHHDQVHRGSADVILAAPAGLCGTSSSRAHAYFGSLLLGCLSALVF
jgi:hypothetical protein